MITQPTIKDTDELLNLWEAAVDENYPLASYEWMSQARNTLKKEAQLLPALRVLKSENGKIVAVIRVDDGIINFLYVHPCERRKEHAQQLVGYVLNHMKIKGAMLRRPRHDTISFYESNGFKLEKETLSSGHKVFLTYQQP